MKRVLVGLVLILLVSGFVRAQRGQQPKPPAVAPAPVAPPARPGDDQTISVEVNLVNILFTVADRKGKFVTNLKKDDFKVFEDEKIQNISNFSSESNLPLSIALLVDTSGSIRDKLKFEQEAAIEFFYSTLQRGKDKAVVISFDSAVELNQDFTDDPEKLAESIAKLEAEMREAAKKFEFERAAELRDKARELRAKVL